MNKNEYVSYNANKNEPCEIFFDNNNRVHFLKKSDKS